MSVMRDFGHSETLPNQSHLEFEEQDDGGKRSSFLHWVEEWETVHQLPVHRSLPITGWSIYATICEYSLRELPSSRSVARSLRPVCDAGFTAGANLPRIQHPYKASWNSVSEFPIPSYARLPSPARTLTRISFQADRRESQKHATARVNSDR